MRSLIKNLLIGLSALVLPVGLIALPEQVGALSVQPLKRDIVLTGFDLTIEEIALIATNGVAVQVDPLAWERVARSHELLLKAAREDKAVYGLNRGVGLNKDKTLFEGDALTEEARLASTAFNRNNLRATSSAAGPAMASKMVSAVMLVKLNSILQGTTGAQPEVAKLLLEFINRGIQPVIPSRGSIGEADITILSHLGLALMGEGDVYFEGQLMSASRALALNGLKPLIPFGKDSLAIMSSNAYSAALGALLIHDAERLVDKADLIVSLSLEGLNGNVAPFIEEVQNVRPYEGQKVSAAKIRQALKGSYLWQRSSERELQDPLSFRSSSQVHGTVRDMIGVARQKIALHLNSSDDNPATILKADSSKKTEQEAAYYLDDGSGAVIPTANFETINWVIDFQALGIALSHLSHASTQRMLRLSSDKFTHLSRFLSPDSTSIIFGAVQKTFVALDTEIRALSAPVSQDSFPVAGEIEDLATNAPLVMQRLCQIVDNLYYVFGLELMHATQAIDLRKKTALDLQLGEATQKLYADYREIVPFIERDRSLSMDIEKSHDFLLSCWPKTLITMDCIFLEKI